MWERARALIVQRLVQKHAATVNPRALKSRTRESLLLFRTHALIFYLAARRSNYSTDSQPAAAAKFASPSLVARKLNARGACFIHRYTRAREKCLFARKIAVETRIVESWALASILRAHVRPRRRGKMKRQEGDETETRPRRFSWRIERHEWQHGAVELFRICGGNRGG